MLRPTWNWVASRLAVAYERGVLVPFIGSGLSRPACPSWLRLIQNLESTVGIERQVADDPETLIRRANVAVLALRNAGPGELAKAVRGALGGAANLVMPPGTELLAAIWWPLVITTNYDNLYAAAHHEKFRNKNAKPSPTPTRPVVFGRSPIDCFNVARSLREVTPPVIWAIQGFVDAPCPERFDPIGRLAAELVVGHEEYRRVTFREAHFRRTFAEVFRSRSFLFLGSGLAEHYLLDLFSEVQEFYGPAGHLHFAIAPEGRLDVDFLLREFQVAVLEYKVGKLKNGDEDHSALIETMTHLPALLGLRGQPPDKILRAGARTTRWEIQANGQTDDVSATFAVDCSPLPTSLTDSGAIAVSAGKQPKSSQLFFSRPIVRTLELLGADDGQFRVLASTPAIGRNRKNKSVFVAIAREHGLSRAPGDDWDEARTLAAVYWATRDLLDVTTAAGFKTVHSQLLASGPSLHDEVQSDGRGPYLPIHALCEMAAAFGDFTRIHKAANGVRLIVHVVDPSVHGELRHGRIRLDEVIGCLDLRIWVAIEPAGAAPSHHLLHVPADEFSTATAKATEDAKVLIGNVAEMFHVPLDWIVDIWPSPFPRWQPATVRRHHQVKVLFAAVTGSTMTFRPPPPK
jgi:hypothetical protein